MGTVFLEVEGVRAAYNGREVLNNITFTMTRGAWLGVVGPNGAGKTTLLRALARVLEPGGGRIILAGHDLRELGREDQARRMTGVGADVPSDFDLTVEQMVLLGRTPHLRRWQSPGPRDRQIVAQALQQTDTHHLAGRLTSHLSAGERQRVLLARALAQQPDLLLLDEPTAHLDIHHQLEIMELLDRLRRERGLTLLSVMHDLNLAALFCDGLVLMKDGEIFAMGPPWYVLSADHVRAVYGCAVRVHRHPQVDAPQVTLLPELRGGPERMRTRGR